MKTALRILALTAASALAATSAYAQTPEGWHGSFTPYLWGAGMTGQTGVRDRTIDVDVSFLDALSHLGGAVVGAGELAHGRVGALADLDYLKLHDDKDVNVAGVLTIGAKATVKSTIATLAGYYRVYDSPKASIDLLAGARYTGGDIQLDLSRAGGPGPGLAVDASKSWWDPVIGARGHLRVGRRSSLMAYVDGGAASSSSSTWQVFGGYQYDFSSRVTGTIGYRYYKVDYRNADFTYDLALSGPLVGVTFKF